MDGMIRVLIADDHAIVREGLRALIGRPAARMEARASCPLSSTGSCPITGSLEEGVVIPAVSIRGTPTVQGCLCGLPGRDFPWPAASRWGM